MYTCKLTSPVFDSGNTFIIYYTRRCTPFLEYLIHIVIKNHNKYNPIRQIHKVYSPLRYSVHTIFYKYFPRNAGVHTSRTLRTVLPYPFVKGLLLAASRVSDTFTQSSCRLYVKHYVQKFCNIFPHRNACNTYTIRCMHSVRNI